MQDEPTVTIAEAARLLRVSRPYVYELIRRGKLAPWRNPAYEGSRGPVRIPLAQVQALAQKS